MDSRLGTLSPNLASIIVFKHALHLSEQFLDSGFVVLLLGNVIVDANKILMPFITTRHGFIGSEQVFVQELFGSIIGL